MWGRPTPARLCRHALPCCHHAYLQVVELHATLVMQNTESNESGLWDTLIPMADARLKSDCLLDT